MDTNRLKRFAQDARRELQKIVKALLPLVLAENSAARREKPQAVAELEKALRTQGDEALIDKIAYTCFNRFCALRFMDVMGYNSIRIVSPLPGHFQPEILEEAKGGNIDETFVTDSKYRARIKGLLDGSIPAVDGQGEAYKLLLVSACNAYNKTMPFLFQKIDDYTELLMPDELMKENSILMKTREAITEDVAADGVEVIGWLYQFYISEKKDEVMGKTVKTEDIPAATQLFTPDWIVRYLVQNSLGRLWMLNHPNSKLAEEMEYYIPPTEADKDFLEVKSPEDLKICDPCCGSGHMLTYAFDLLVKIYEEEGYDRRKIPTLILVKNLHGVEIDTRAGELAAFALTMKAREYDSRFLRRENAPYPQICVLQNITFDEGDIPQYMEAIGHDLFTENLQQTLHQFTQADCFGSLIVPKISNAVSLMDVLTERGVEAELFLAKVHDRVLDVVNQADYLSQKYHVVVTNPPYMGGKGMNADLKRFAERLYPDSKSDLFAMFIERGFDMVMPKGYSAMVTMQSWMFLSSYEKLREKLLDNYTMECLCHMANMVMGIAFGTSATVWKNQYVPDYKGAFCFVEYEDIENSKPGEFPPFNDRNKAAIRNNEAEKAAMFREAIR